MEDGLVRGSEAKPSLSCPQCSGSGEQNMTCDVNATGRTRKARDACSSKSKGSNSSSGGSNIDVKSVFDVRRVQPALFPHVHYFDHDPGPRRPMTSHARTVREQRSQLPHESIQCTVYSSA